MDVHESRRISVLVLGATGMAGHVVSRYLKQAGYRVTRAVRGPAGRCRDSVWLDATDDGQLAQTVESGDYDVIVNCIGSLVSESARWPARAVRLNALLPRELEDLTSGSTTRVIHLSTDCVFSGATGPYAEGSFRDGDSVYDRAKALGEIDNDKDLTLRMSIIGPEIRPSGTGLMHWFLGQSGEVPGYTGAIWNGITTLELAQAIETMLTPGTSGIYHLVPPYSISKFDLLEKLRREFGRNDIRLVPVDTVKADKTLLDTRRSAPFEVGKDGYDGMIQRLHQWIRENEDLYAGVARYGPRGLTTKGN